MKSASQRQEARVARRFGGRTTPGSGNQWDRKNDVRTPDTSFELKVTGKKQYTLKASDLETGEKNALRDGRRFVFGIEVNGRNWVLLSEDDYAELTEPHWTTFADTVLVPAALVGEDPLRYPNGFPVIKHQERRVTWS